MMDDHSQFHMDDPALIHERDQRLAQVMDELRNSDEFVVFTRKEGDDAIECTGLVSTGNYEPWANALNQIGLDMIFAHLRNRLR